MPTSGCCYLVGAVPGSPSLLTTKALRLIQAATLLLVDDLVSPEIVALASPRARARFWPFSDSRRLTVSGAGVRASPP